MTPKVHTFNVRQHMLRRTYEIYRYRDSYLKEVALHHHDFYEIYLFLSGNVTYSIESRSYNLSPGDILLINPMELHQPNFRKESQIYERIVLWIDKNYLNQFVQADQELSRCFDASMPWHTNLLRPDEASRQQLTDILHRLLEETESDAFASELFAQTYLLQALILINRLAEQTPQAADVRDQSDSVVENVLLYINEHFHEDLSLDRLANQFFISKYHLSREFNRLVGTSVYRYITQKRLINAKQLMRDGMPSTVVYQQCGFGDYSNFYRAFKSEYQISPKEFIASMKSDGAVARRRGRDRDWFAQNQEQ